MQRVLLCCLLTVLLYSAWYHLSIQFCLARVKRLRCSQARKVWELLMRVTPLACECCVHTSFMMLRRSVLVSDGEVLGAFSSARMGSYAEKELFVLYCIQFYLYSVLQPPSCLLLMFDFQLTCYVIGQLISVWRHGEILFPFYRCHLIYPE